MTMKEIEMLTPASQLNAPEVPMVTKKQKITRKAKAAEATEPAKKTTKKTATPAETKLEPTNVVAITKPTKRTKKTEPVAPTVPEPKAEPVATKEPKDSARRLFHDLIMLGTLTDKEILAEVAAKLHWTPEQTEKRKRYVAWYRSELKTVLGKNPPAAKQTA